MFIIFGGWGLLLFPFAAVAVFAGGFLAQEFGLKNGSVLLLVAGIFAFLCVSCGMLLKNAGRRSRDHVFFISLELWGIATMVGTVALVLSANEHISNSAQAASDAPVTSTSDAGTPTAVPAAPACVSNPDSSKVRVFCWTKTVEKDPMTDGTNEKIVSEVVFPDGTDVEAEVKFDGLAVDFYMRTFQNEKPSPFAFNDQKTLSIRVRVDGGDVRSATAPEQLTNEVFVFFYDPAAARAAVGINNTKPASDPKNGTQFLGSLFNMAMSMQVGKLAGMAAGELNELTSAQHILVELPLSDGSSNVVDLNPSDPLVKQFVLKNLASIRDRLGATEQPSENPTAESPGEGEQPAIPRPPSNRKVHRVKKRIQDQPDGSGDTVVSPFPTEKRALQRASIQCYTYNYWYKGRDQVGQRFSCVGMPAPSTTFPDIYPTMTYSNDSNTWQPEGHVSPGAKY